MLNGARKRLLGFPLEKPAPSPCQGGHIRTLSLSLLAVATVAAGVLISRVRLPESITKAVKRPEPARPVVSLDALRGAGL